MTAVKDVLVKLEEIPELVDKHAFKIFINQVCSPEYIDFNRAGSFAILRFDKASKATEFLRQQTHLESFELRKSLVQGQEEEEYWQKVDRLRNNFKFFNFSKKQKMEDS